MKAMTKAFLMCLALAAPQALGFARAPSLEDRIAAQRAIEQVYWNHRIWPKENPQPKPALEVVLPPAAIRARVEDTLEKSNALEQLWKRRITAEQLQAEMDRMAAHSRDPQVLGEIFAALGNDATLAAETLARRTLADRLIRSWYASDDRFHAAVRERAVASLSACGGLDCMRTMGGAYRETTWRLRSDDESESPEMALHGTAVHLDGAEWNDHIDRVAAVFPGSGLPSEQRHELASAVDARGVSPVGEHSSRDGRTDLDSVSGGGLNGGQGSLIGPRPADELLASLPLRRLSGLEETPDGFVVTAVLARGADEVTVATVTWSKRSFDDWWGANRAGFAREALQIPSGPEAFSLASPTVTACSADTWSSMARTALPDPRGYHTAVWTGSEMIVWGGYANGSRNTGSRYNPATDTWTAISTGANVPSARYRHSAVWTGTQMIVWGGYNGTAETNTGGRYDPTTDTWTPTSTGANVPTAREAHTAVWTGTQVIVWGGYNAQSFSYSNTGGRYDPSADTWTPTSTGANVPSARAFHTAVWTGTEMIVWGAYDGFYRNTGGRYSPSSDTWTATSTGANVPLAREIHTAVWTGSEMIVWGGHTNFGSANTGGRYNPSNDSWTATSTGANVPPGTESHTAVWTGTEMIVWGGGNGGFNTGGRYNPGNDTWVATSTGPNVPSLRKDHTAVWTGTEMIVWGGDNYNNGLYLDTGGRYDPTTNTWVVTTGEGGGASGRQLHAALWTGAEMIVWGGQGGTTALNNGGRYDPATDTWLSTSTGTNVPSARFSHAAVWTGTGMLVWGGYDASTYFNTGGRYNPTTNSWISTSTGTNVPSARSNAAAVWTGTQMIVWGGVGAGNVYVNTGGRYSPSSNTWTATSTGTNVPSARAPWNGLWTGTEMIVWGGFVGGTYMNTGGRYNPSSNTWTATSTGTNVPSARRYPTTLWTGTEMIVWGGLDGSTFQVLNDGGRYHPSSDTWTSTSTGANVPLPRFVHSAAWTGEEMIVWGGSATGGSTTTGGRYTPSSDTWAPTSTGTNVPSARAFHTAAMASKQMIVWGGQPYTASGGLYCACPNGGTFYRDVDGDGYGIVSDSRATCDGSVPAGYAPANGDCNDAVGAIHPGAAEACNVIDDDCDGSIDNAPAPSGHPPLTETRSGTNAVISWAGVPGATGYDIVKGSLPSLQTSGGNFTTSTTGCLGNNLAGTTVNDTAVPAPGGGSWHLVRPVSSCGGSGSYDDGAPSQVGSRDTEIQASASACP